MKLPKLSYKNSVVIILLVLALGLVAIGYRMGELHERAELEDKYYKKYESFLMNNAYRKLLVSQLAKKINRRCRKNEATVFYDF